jgi:hypothetical protein
MQSLNARVDALRKTRVALRKAIDAAKLIGDRCDREKRIYDLTITLRSTEPDWQAMQAEQEARSTRIDLAQLRHQGSRPSAAPVRRSAAPYLTRMLGGR